MENCVSWSETNHLPIKNKKCKVLDIVAKRNLSLPPVYFSDSSRLPNVCDFKILGVTFSSSLKWNYYLKDIMRKASQRIFVIRNLKRADCPSHAPNFWANKVIIVLCFLILAGAQRVLAGPQASLGARTRAHAIHCWSQTSIIRHNVLQI